MPRKQPQNESLSTGDWFPSNAAERSIHFRRSAARTITIVLSLAVAMVGFGLLLSRLANLSIH